MSLCASCVHRGHLPWVREAPFQVVHCVPHFLSLSNNLGNLLFARQTSSIIIQTGFRCSFERSESRCTQLGERTAPHLRCVWRVETLILAVKGIAATLRKNDRWVSE
jgi:hypothetical protein